MMIHNSLNFIVASNVCSVEVLLVLLVQYLPLLPCPSILKMDYGSNLKEFLHTMERVLCLLFNAFLSLFGFGQHLGYFHSKCSHGMTRFC